tara:strand:- start:3694 stop:3909 length:216 start_codon:yes stop_codon:yes gene_type:complete
MYSARVINKNINNEDERMKRRDRIKRLIHKPIDMGTTAIATTIIFSMIYVACLPYLLGKKSAKPTHDPIDF